MDKNRVHRHIHRSSKGRRVTRPWVVRECFLEEVIFKVAEPGRREEKVPKGTGISRCRALKARELHSPRTENGLVRHAHLLRDK